MKKTLLLLVILSQTLFGATVPDKMHYLFKFSNDYYGKLTGTVETASIRLYGDDKTILFEQDFNNVPFKNGLASFHLEDAQLDQWLPTIDKATHIGVFIEEFGTETIETIFTVPFSIMAEESMSARSVAFESVNDIPESLQFITDNTEIVSDSNTKEITIHNKSRNNNTASSITLKSDLGSNYVSISSLKNNQGQLKTHISSKDDIEFYRDGKLVLKLGKDNFQMNGYSPLSENDILAMGFIKNNGYLTSTDMSSYILDNDSRLSDARTPYVSSQLNGDLLYYEDGWKRLPKGDDNQILSIESGYPTWKDASGSVSNSVSQAGYVPAGQGYGNSFYATDSTGVPAWRPISSALIGLPNVQNINVQESWNMNDNQILGLETITAVNNNGITIKDNDDQKTLEIYDNGDIKVYNSFDVVGSTTLSSLDLTQALDGDDVESASLIKQGAVQLSNAFDGTSESKATTEKALKDGLATKQGADSDLSDLADGSLTGSKIGSGINASNITTGTLSSSRLDSDLQDLADGSLSGSKIGSGVNASNITTGSLSSSRLDSDLQDLADGSLSGNKIGSGINASNITTGTLATARLEQNAQNVIYAGSNTSSPFPVKAFATINSNGTKQSGYYNVSSTSRTQVTFSSAMSNSNYTVILSLQNPYDIDEAYNSRLSFDIEVYVGTKTTTGFSYSCRIVRYDKEYNRDTIYYKSCSFMVLSN